MHELSSSRPLLCGEMVDRVRELQELHEAVERAAAGNPQLVLLAGEAGMGKTKLCRAFMQTSQERRVLALFGLAIPQDQALPFGPFLDAFRRYFMREANTVPDAHSSQHTAFASVLRFFPELVSLFPKSVSSSFALDGRTVQSQQAVFHGILSALQELARSGPGPLLLILEDLHWADETSLELLAFLAQRLDTNASLSAPAHPEQQGGLLILGTYRAEALPENPALSRLLLQLRAQRHARDIHLAPLSAGDHRRCVTSTERGSRCPKSSQASCLPGMKAIHSLPRSCWGPWLPVASCKCSRRAGSSRLV
jgi:predicted ATPase